MITNVHRISTSTVFDDHESHQYKALEWLTFADGFTYEIMPTDDSLVTDLGEKLIMERYILAVFFYSKGGSGGARSLWKENGFAVYGDQPSNWLSSLSICDSNAWYGISRNSNGDTGFVDTFEFGKLFVCASVIVYLISSVMRRFSRCAQNPH